MRGPVRFLVPLLFLLPLAACPGGDAPGGIDVDPDVPEPERYGGTAVIGALSDIPDMNPLTARLHGVSNRLRNVHPDPRGDWVGVDRWWIVPQQRGARVPGAETVAQ